MSVASAVHAFPLGDPGYATFQGLPPGPELMIDPELRVLWSIPV